MFPSRNLKVRDLVKMSSLKFANTIFEPKYLETFVSKLKGWKNRWMADLKFTMIFVRTNLRYQDKLFPT